MTNYREVNGVISIAEELIPEVIEKSSGLHAFQKEVMNFVISSFAIKDSKNSGYPNITFYDASGQSFRTHVFELVREIAPAFGIDQKDFLRNLDLNQFKGQTVNRRKDGKGNLKMTVGAVQQTQTQQPPQNQGGMFSQMKNMFTGQ